MVSITVGELATQLGLECYGATGVLIESVASYDSAETNQLTFLTSVKNTSNLDTDAVVITTKFLADKLNIKSIILSENPQLSFAKAIPLILKVSKAVAGVDSSAVVADSAKIDSSAEVMANVVIESGVSIGADVVIGANSFVGKNCRIGDSTQIDANVSVYADTIIGRDCRISSGVVIGAPGFGIIPEGKKWHRFPQVGKVVIGDKVDIGANCCIDRGAIDDTIIGSGVKLDNLIQIAHNVKIGDNTVIAACTGIAGSAVIGENCQIGGRASIQGHIEITDNVVITTCTFVNKSIPKPGVYSSSISMQENAQWLKNHARLHRLDKIYRQVNKLENKFNQKSLQGERSGK